LLPEAMRFDSAQMNFWSFANLADFVRKPCIGPRHDPSRLTKDGFNRLADELKMLEMDVTRNTRGLAKLPIVVILTTLLAFAGAAIALHRQALWQVIRVCVASSELFGAAFPCRQIDLAVGNERGVAIVQPPLLNDLIVVPTRKVTGVEDAFLQSLDAPNYFAAAWRTRALLRSPDGREPDWGEVGLVVNPVVGRSQDQLHIHVGCLFPGVQSALANVAPKVPVATWAKLPEVVPHIAFWGTRVAKSTLEGVEPFRLAAEALSDRVTERGKLTLMVAGVRVAGADEFLILASYAGAPHSWWPVGSENLIDTRCPS
jgi:CDP-diacylglycerol pyrophosphatase